MGVAALHLFPFLANLDFVALSFEFEQIGRKCLGIVWSLACCAGVPPCVLAETAGRHKSFSCWVDGGLLGVMTLALSFTDHHPSPASGIPVNHAETPTVETAWSHVRPSMMRFIKVTLNLLACLSWLKLTADATAYTAAITACGRAVKWQVCLEPCPVPNVNFRRHTDLWFYL